MHVDFLAAADGTPLTKSFSLTDGAIQKGSYPLVKIFNSFREKPETLRDFYEVMVTHASNNHCLLKGTTDKELNNESRAGHTNGQNETDWICLDLDFSEGFSSIDAFLFAIDPALMEVSYILQHSPSSGIEGPVGLRSHIYFRIATPQMPSVLKEWLKAKNFSVPSLRRQLSLSVNGMSLRFPLDITTCQNDKLLYIAPPTLDGIDDPLADNRIVFVEKANEFADLDFYADAELNRERFTECVDQLREAAGMQKRKAKYKTLKSGHIEYLQNPNRCTVSGVKEMNGFIRLNFAGGNDSWGHYFPVDNPEFLYNFKEEPIVRLRDIAPEFYHDYKTAMGGAPQDDQDFIPFAFRNFEDDSYYNAIFSPSKNYLRVNRTSSREKIRDFLIQYGAEVPEYIEDWTYEFDPTSLDLVRVDKKWVNKFEPTEYLLNAPKNVIDVPPTIKRVIFSMVGSDQTCYNHFINWLAFIVKYRERPKTAIVVQGIEGTGKGLLYRLMHKALGKHACEITTERFDEQFNAYLETCLYLFVDEFNVGDTASTRKSMNKIKGWVTEDHIMIRAMRTDPYQKPARFGMVFAMNDRGDTVRITDHDRRFNVYPRQEVKLELTQAEVDRALNEELPLFIGYLLEYNVNEKDVRTVLDTPARREMVISSRSAIDQFFYAVKEGDLHFFTDHLREKPALADPAYVAFERILRDWAYNANQEEPCAIPNEDLRLVFQYLIPGVPAAKSPTKFGKLASINNINTVRFYKDGQRCRGTFTHWTGNQTDIDAWLNKEKVAKLVG